MKDDLIAGVGNITAWSLTLAEFKETAMTISYILASITSLVTIGYIIYKWYKKAKADGKITADEVAELANDLKNNIEKEKNEND